MRSRLGAYVMLVLPGPVWCGGGMRGENGKESVYCFIGAELGGIVSFFVGLDGVGLKSVWDFGYVCLLV